MILIAINYNGRVCAYNDDKIKILDVSGKLYNYTDSTITVSCGDKYDIYDSTGNRIATYPYDFIDLSGLPII